VVQARGVVSCDVSATGARFTLLDGPAEHAYTHPIFLVVNDLGGVLWRWVWRTNPHIS
jgi:hypothetical protein